MAPLTASSSSIVIAIAKDHTHFVETSINRLQPVRLFYMETSYTLLLSPLFAARTFHPSGVTVTSRKACWVLRNSESESNLRLAELVAVGQVPLNCLRWPLEFD